MTTPERRKGVVDFGRTRELCETARNIAFRVKGVSDVAFQPVLLSRPERRRLHSHLVEVREWADRLLQELGEPGRAPALRDEART